MHAALDPLPGQVRGRVCGGAEEQVADVVGEDAVHLFGHAPVVRAQTRLDVRDRDVHLRGDQRTGEGRVGVSVDEHPRRADLARNSLEAGHHGAGLRAMRARTDSQVDVRLGYAELTEEDLRHVVVVVLAGVDEHLLVAPPDGAADRSRLDELRTCADDGYDLHATPISWSHRRTMADQL